MDVCNLDFPASCFDVVFDKGMLDTLLTSSLALPQSKAMLKEVYRVLRPGGMLLLVSHASPARRLPYLTQMARIPKPRASIATQPAQDNSKDTEVVSSCYFVYLCRKPIVDMEFLEDKSDIICTRQKPLLTSGLRASPLEIKATSGNYDSPKSKAGQGIIRSMVSSPRGLDVSGQKSSPASRLFPRMNRSHVNAEKSTESLKQKPVEQMSPGRMSSKSTPEKKSTESPKQKPMEQIAAGFSLSEGKTSVKVVQDVADDDLADIVRFVEDVEPASATAPKVNHKTIDDDLADIVGFADELEPLSPAPKVDQNDADDELADIIGFVHDQPFDEAPQAEALAPGIESSPQLHHADSLDVDDPRNLEEAF